MSIQILHMLVKKGIISKKEARDMYQSNSMMTDEDAKEMEYIWQHNYDGSLD
ncbi:MAG TPA: hypothetical protein VJ571_01065 [Candidatus Nitrosotalea sp.]|nr:hypothetical protein [Candidatus Nitrosotalea sp.]